MSFGKLIAVQFKRAHQNGWMKTQYDQVKKELNTFKYLEELHYFSKAEKEATKC